VVVVGRVEGWGAGRSHSVITHFGQPVQRDRRDGFTGVLRTVGRSQFIPYPLRARVDATMVYAVLVVDSGSDRGASVVFSSFFGAEPVATPFTRAYDASLSIPCMRLASHIASSRGGSDLRRTYAQPHPTHPFVSMATAWEAAAGKDLNSHTDADAMPAPASGPAPASALCHVSSRRVSQRTIRGQRARTERNRCGRTGDKPS